MKRFISSAIAVTAALGLAAPALAADTGTLTVQASVRGVCKFISGSATLNFGILDPSVGGNVDAPQSSVTYWCTKGITNNLVTANNGLHFGTARNMQDPVSLNLIPYSLTLTDTGVSPGGPSVTLTVNIDGQVLGSDYTGKTAGDYSDTVTLNVNN